VEITGACLRGGARLGLAGARRARRSGGQFSTTSGPGAPPRYGEAIWALAEVDWSSVRIERRWGRLGAAAQQRRACSGRYGELRATTTGAKGQGRWSAAHRGAVGAGGATEEGWRRRPAAERSGCSRTARCGAPPGLLVHQINTCRSCEGVKGVSGAGDAPAVSNCAAARATHRKSGGGTGQCKRARAAGARVLQGG
jgi:hypothetical protein